MENKPFIGMGDNPDGPDLPIGFSMHLAQQPAAVAGYGRLTKEQQAAVIRYIRGASTGDDVENRIARAVQCLSEGDCDQIFRG
ncbi:MAG: YdeI/OmpD-associated family protein [Clostridiales bacterium]|nr:YdeI/OmpD-associated family protein [Clostridiales bacterium]